MKRILIIIILIIIYNLCQTPTQSIEMFSEKKDTDLPTILFDDIDDMVYLMANVIVNIYNLDPVRLRKIYKHEIPGTYDDYDAGNYTANFSEKNIPKDIAKYWEKVQEKITIHRFNYYLYLMHRYPRSEELKQIKSKEELERIIKYAHTIGIVAKDDIDTMLSDLNILEKN